MVREAVAGENPKIDRGQQEGQRLMRDKSMKDWNNCRMQNIGECDWKEASGYSDADLT